MWLVVADDGQSIRGFFQMVVRSPHGPDRLGGTARDGAARQ